MGQYLGHIDWWSKLDLLSSSVRCVRTIYDDFMETAKTGTAPIWKPPTLIHRFIDEGVFKESRSRGCFMKLVFAPDLELHFCWRQNNVTYKIDWILILNLFLLIYWAGLFRKLNKKNKVHLFARNLKIIKILWQLEEQCNKCAEFIANMKRLFSDPAQKWDWQERLWRFKVLAFQDFLGYSNTVVLYEPCIFCVRVILNKVWTQCVISNSRSIRPSSL